MNQTAVQRFSVLILVAVWNSACASDQTPWIQGNHVIVNLSSPEEAGYERYELWMAGAGDVRVEEIEETGGKKSMGSLLLVGGRILAVRGIDVQPGMEIDAIDVPALNWQLAAQLLERAIPNGPGPTLPANEVRVSEREKALEVGTTSASGEYGAPWTVAANVSRYATGPVHYQLDFQFTDQESGKLSPPMKLSGAWEHQQPGPKISDDLSIVGSNLFTLGPVRKVAKDGQIFDYSSSSLEMAAKTVGDLRKIANTRD